MMMVKALMAVVTRALGPGTVPTPGLEVGDGGYLTTIAIFAQRF